jgi:hypothetical protein
MSITFISIAFVSGFSFNKQSGILISLQRLIPHSSKTTGATHVNNFGSPNN